MNISDFILKKEFTIQDLLSIMQILRSDIGCPWDKEQNHSSIRKNFIEETYEVCEAIDNDDMELLKEELGDVLLQVVFHSQMEAESNTFSFSDVVNDICKKLIVRHPHVFGNVEVSNSSEVLDNWQNIKQKTKGQTTALETLLSVPRQLPALMRSQKIQGRAQKANQGFGCSSPQNALGDLKGEVGELEFAVLEKNIDSVADELGDVMFASVNVAQSFGLDAEELLTRSCDKFIKRFNYVESLAKENDVKLQNVGAEQLDAFWKKSKANT